MSSVEDINDDDSPESLVNSKDVALLKEEERKKKSPPKIIRVLTVLAYILSVSMAAILLSIYYIFMWNEQKTYDPYNESVVPSTSVASSTFMEVEEANITTPDYATDELPQIGR